MKSVQVCNLVTWLVLVAFILCWFITIHVYIFINCLREKSKYCYSSVLLLSVHFVFNATPVIFRLYILKKLTISTDIESKSSKIKTRISSRPRIIEYVPWYSFLTLCRMLLLFRSRRFWQDLQSYVFRPFVWTNKIYSLMQTAVFICFTIVRVFR